MDYYFIYVDSTTEHPKWLSPTNMQCEIELYVIRPSLYIIIAAVWLGRKNNLVAEPEGKNNNYNMKFINYNQGDIRQFDSANLI